jgi:hypothetical protein
MSVVVTENLRPTLGTILDGPPNNERSNKIRGGLASILAISSYLLLESGMGVPKNIADAAFLLLPFLYGLEAVRQSNKAESKIAKKTPFARY